MTRKTKSALEASIVGGRLYFEDVLQCVVPDQYAADEDKDAFSELISDKSLKTIRLVSLSNTYYVNEWLGGDTYHKSYLDAELTLRKEVVKKKGQAVGTEYWYAYRRRLGQLQKKYVGRSSEVDAGRLYEIVKKYNGL